MKSIEFKNELLDFVKLLSGGIETAFRPTVESFGLTMLQTRVLAEIKQNEKSTVGSLRNIIGASSGNASTVCKKLEKAGFITRIRNVEDERVVNLALTNYGRETVQKIEEILQNRYKSVLDSKTDEDFKIILGGMKKMKEILEEMSKI